MGIAIYRLTIIVSYYTCTALETIDNVDNNFHYKIEARILNPLTLRRINKALYQLY